VGRHARLGIAAHVHAKIANKFAADALSVALITFKPELPTAGTLLPTPPSRMIFAIACISAETALRSSSRCRPNAGSPALPELSFPDGAGELRHFQYSNFRFDVPRSVRQLQTASLLTAEYKQKGFR
jgi:hypothetical protein